MFSVLVLACLFCYVTPQSGEMPAEYILNLRRSMTEDQRLLGFIEGMMLMNHDDNAIRNQLRTCMGDMCPPDNRINNLIERAHAVAALGTTRRPLAPTQSPQDTIDLRQERVQAAQRFLDEYNRDNAILTRIIAIDEMWLCEGRLALVAAYHMNKIVAHMIFEDRQMNRNDFLAFLENRLFPLFRSRSSGTPILLMDNHRIHHTAEVGAAIARENMIVWYQPRLSPDMMPLDIDAFSCLRKQFKKECYSGMGEMTRGAHRAVEAVNNDNCLNGMSNLVNQWLEVISMGGASRRPHLVTTPKSIDTSSSDDDDEMFDGFRNELRKRRSLEEPIPSLGLYMSSNCTPEKDFYTGSQCPIKYSETEKRTVSFGCREGFCWSSCTGYKYMTHFPYSKQHLWCPTSMNPKTLYLTPCRSVVDCDPCWPCAKACRELEEYMM